jgi:hypothetical protein
MKLLVCLGIVWAISLIILLLATKLAAHNDE